jgi:hypothetical protein
MEKMFFIKCDRCMGVMISDTFYGFQGRFRGWKCLICGEIVDPVILENRQLMNAGQIMNLQRRR